MEKSILPYFNGLGDHLQFSTIPELASKKNYKCFYHVNCQFRNDEVKELVYDCNPFIHGCKDGKPDYGDGNGSFDYQNCCNNFIKNIESASGFEPTNTLAKIYYEPKKVGDYDCIIDLNAISIKLLDFEKLKIAIENTVFKKFNKKEVLLVTNKFGKNENYFSLKEIQVESLKNYVDLISSSKHYYSMSSGGHILATSIRHFGYNFEQTCFLPENFEPFVRPDRNGMGYYEYCTKNNFWIFPQVEYIKF